MKTSNFSPRIKIILRCYLLLPAKTSSRTEASKTSEPIELEAAVVCRRIHLVFNHDVARWRVVWQVFSGVGDYVSRNATNYGGCLSGGATYSQDGIHCFDTFLPRVRIVHLLCHLMLTYYGAGTDIPTGYLLRKVYYNVWHKWLTC